MTGIVFGIEILIHKIEFIHINSFPSLTIICNDGLPKTLLPYSVEAHDNDVWNDPKAFQMIFNIDAFESVVSWPISFEIVSPVESTALGKCTFELKPLICDSIAAHGPSQIVTQRAVLRDFERHEVAYLTFEIRVIFFKICQKPAAIIDGVARNMRHGAKSIHGSYPIRSASEREDPHARTMDVKASSSYRFMPALGNVSSGTDSPRPMSNQILEDIPSTYRKTKGINPMTSKKNSSRPK